MTDSEPSAKKQRTHADGFLASLKPRKIKVHSPDDKDDGDYERQAQFGEHDLTSNGGTVDIDVSSMLIRILTNNVAQFSQAEMRVAR